MQRPLQDVDGTREVSVVGDHRPAVEANVAQFVGELAPFTFTKALETLTEMQDESQFGMTLNHRFDVGLDRRGEVIDGELTNCTQPDTAVWEIVDRFEHRVRLGAHWSLGQLGQRGPCSTEEMLQHLRDHPSATEPEPFAGPDHPIRQRTRAVASGEAWTAGNAARMAELFDSMAADWSAKHVDDIKAAPVLDALDRGGVPIDGDWLELGSGTGAGTRLLSDVVGSLMATDLSAEMLRHAPGELAPRVHADASTLPFPTDAFDAVLMINMLLFPNEVDRVLRPGGVVVWVNTLGDQTPIHLPPDDVLAALPGDWDGLTARAGTGFWLATHRR